MTETPTPGQMPETPAQPVADPKPQDGGKPEDSKPETFPREYVEELRQESTKYRKQARDLEKRLSDIEAQNKQAEDAKLAEQNEWKTLAEKRAAELETQQKTFAERELALLRKTVASQYASRLVKPEGEDLDPVSEFAVRLSGATEEELKADAERLIKLFGTPPAQAPEQPGRKPPTTTASPSGTPAVDKEAIWKAQRKRLGQESPMFVKQEAEVRVITDKRELKRQYP